MESRKQDGIPSTTRHLESLTIGYNDSRAAAELTDEFLISDFTWGSNQVAAQLSTTDMESSTSPTLSARKTPPMRRSCELCRASKTKCLPCEDGDSRKCQRCTRDGKECVFAPAQQRAKRAHKSHLRVAEMEKKLDGIYALLSGTSSSGGSQTSPQAAPVHVPPPPPSMQGPSPPETSASSTTSPHPSLSTNPTTVGEPPDEGSACNDFFRADSKNAPGRPAYVYNDLIDRGLLSHVAANFYLNRFRSHATHFPFVVLGPDVTVDELRRDRPFLFLAIIVMASPLDTDDQVTSEREFREHFAKRFVVEGEKSMDILQGLMVYLNWYHRYFSPQKQNLWSFTHVIVAIASELGITKPKRTLGDNDPFSSKGCAPEILPVGKASAVEARRTLLGVYWFASVLSSAMRKQTIFRHTTYIDECCSLLSELHEAPTDSLLIYFIQLAKLSEDISQTFGFDGTLDTRSLSAMTIEFSLRSFKSRLTEIRNKFSKEAEETVSLLMIYRSIKMFVNEISLYVPHDSEATLHSWTTSPVRTGALIDFLTACREYLDAFLALSWGTIQKSSSYEATRLIYVIMLLSYAALDMQYPPMPLTELRKMLNLPGYLDALNALIESHITVINGVERKDLYWQFGLVFQQAKERYIRRTTPQQQLQQQSQHPLSGTTGHAASPSNSQAETLGMQRDMDNHMMLDAPTAGTGMQEQWNINYPFTMDISDDQFWAEMMGQMSAMGDFN